MGAVRAPAILARMSDVPARPVNRRRILLVSLVLLVINLPYLTHEWQKHRAATHGTQVTATVIGVSRSGDDSVVDFRLPKNVDPSQDVREVKVDPVTGAAAGRTQQLDVRVLSGHPAIFHVDGQVRLWGATIITIGADLLIVLMLLLSWRLGGRLRRPGLVAFALADVASGEDGSLLDRQDDGSYLINGAIAEIGAESMVLSLRDRDVTIHLRGFSNPVGVGESAQVRAQLVG